mgnify:CR=1 FL=1
MALSIAFMYLCAVLLLIPYIGALWLAFGGDRMRAEQEGSSGVVGTVSTAVTSEAVCDKRLARSA